LFARVAAETFQQGKYFIKQDILVKHIETFLHRLPAGDQAGDIDGEVVLKAIEMQHSIFVERAQKIYSFSHLTFQEYFTAKYIADNPKAIKELMGHCTDGRWREVFLLTVSLLDEENADEFFAEFQRAVVALISQDETLVKLLNWANEKAVGSQSSYKIAAVRSVYIFLTLTLNRDLDRCINPDRLDRSLAITLAFARTFAHSLDLAIVRTLARALTLARSRSLFPNIRIDYLLVIMLLIVNRFGNSNTFQKLRDNIPKFILFFAEVVAICQRFSELQAELRNLTLPTKNDKQSTWQYFEVRLRNVMQRHRNIGHEWDFEWELSEKLESYLEANVLLVECLKLAMVSDRKVIEDRVLLLTD